MKKSISETVKLFYEKNPFPDYELEKYKERYNLVDASYPFAKHLDRFIPHGTSIIDVGCGTGQLSSFLSLKNRKVLGIDFSETSISKAKKLKKKLDLKNVEFRVADVLNLGLKEKFDYVFCLGVLHHTGDAYSGFVNLCKLTKKNGFIILGLYNRYGRLLLKTRKALLHTIFKNSKTIRDFFIKKQIAYLNDEKRKESWYLDQYEHPHETTHTVAEVLDWFKKNNIRFVNSIPSLSLFDNFSLDFQNIFQKRKINLNSRYILLQLKWIFSKDKEGGYFIMVGQKE